MVTERSFAFHGSKIGRAKAAFEAGGFPPIDIYPIGNGMYAIVVMLPPSIEAVDWELLNSWQQRRRRRWRFPNWRRLAMIAAVLAIVIGGGWLLYAAVAPGPDNVAAAQPGLALPSGEFSFLDQIGDQVRAPIQKPVDDMANMAAMGIRAFFVCVALLILFLVRGLIWAIISGIAVFIGSFTKGKGQ